MCRTEEVFARIAFDVDGRGVISGPESVRSPREMIVNYQNQTVFINDQILLSRIIDYMNFEPCTAAHVEVLQAKTTGTFLRRNPATTEERDSHPERIV
jgi:hypothetical protein